jgi:smad nuclear-interacting protein 1
MNFEDEIKKTRQQREKFKTSSYEDEFYSKDDSNNYTNHIETTKFKKEESDEEEDPHDTAANMRKTAQQYAAPEYYLNESAKLIEKENPKDVFSDFRRKTISERENTYTSRWRKRDLNNESKSYSERLLENQIDREKQEVLFKLQKQEREEKRKEELEKKRKLQEEEEAKAKKKQKIFKTEHGEEEVTQEEKPELKEEPNFKPTGKLYKGTNTLNGVELKWFEPPELQMPSKKWRLHIFKDKKQISEPYKIYKQTGYLFGRDHSVVDIPIDHESCSKQHAVLCFREVEGKKKKKVKPYIIDLQSTNGTFLNDEKIDDSRYYELHEFDILKFGHSTREYMILHEDSNL